jgi:hypothetical protein
MQWASLLATWSVIEWVSAKETGLDWQRASEMAICSVICSVTWSAMHWVAA